MHSAKPRATGPRAYGPRAYGPRTQPLDGVLSENGYSFSDSDAATYVGLVEAADGESLEDGVKEAIDNFVAGCKTDGIWDAIKASCILAGARTLDGALIPLVGAAPTNYNFVGGDYSRTDGLTGNRSNKFLDSNRASSDDPQNNAHWSVFPTAYGTSATSIMENQFTSVPEDLNGFYFAQSALSAIRSRSGSGSPQTQTVTYDPSKLVGASRSSGTSFTQRYNGISEATAENSRTPSASNYFVLARNAGSSTGTLFADSTVAFYSIGEALDLALLDTRVTALISAIGAALA